MDKRDDLAKYLHDTLNKKFKGERVAYFLDEDTFTPTDVSGWVSSGCTVLDIAISNGKIGGAPYGKITELQGLEGCVTEDTKVKIIVT